MTADATGGERGPGAAEVALGLLAVALVQGFAYPQAAYPLHALLGVVLLALAVLAAVAACGWSLPRWPHGVAACLLAALVVHAWWNGSRGPVPVFGWEPGSHMLQFALAAGAGMLAGRGLPDDRRSALPRLGVAFVAGLLAVESAWGIYVAEGPAWAPRTYASLLAEHAGDLDMADAVGEGLLHALREARAAGTLGAPNVFAGVAAAGAVLALGGFLAEEGRARLAFAAGAIACGSGVLLSGSRGGLLALGFGVVLVVVLGGVLARKHVRRAAAVASLVVLLHPATGGAADEPARSRWLGHTTVVQRLRYWESGMTMWREAPVLGLGAGAYEVLYPSHRVAGSGETQFAHNWVVQAGAEGGALGVGLRLAALAVLLGMAFAGPVGGDAQSVRHRAALAAALGTLLAHGLVDYTLETREGMLLLGALLGLLAGSGPQVPHSGLRGGGLALFAGALAASVPLHFSPARHELRVENAATALAEGDPPAEMQKWLGDAFDAWPDDPRGPAFRGRLAMALGDGAAVGHFERAAELNPWSASAQEELAFARLRFGDGPGALAAIRKGNELHPLDPMHWLSRAEIEFALGDAAAAREGLARARGLARNPQEEARLRALEERIR